MVASGVAMTALILAIVVLIGGSLMEIMNSK